MGSMPFYARFLKGRLFSPCGKKVLWMLYARAGRADVPAFAPEQII